MLTQQEFGHGCIGQPLACTSILGQILSLRFQAKESHIDERDSKRRRTGSITRYTISLERKSPGTQHKIPGSGIASLEMRKQGENCPEENAPKTHKLPRSDQNLMDRTSGNMETPRKKKKEEFQSVLEMFKKMEGGKSENKRKTDKNPSQNNSARSDQKNISSKINILPKKVQSRPSSLKKCQILSKIKPKKTNKKTPQISLKGENVMKITDIRSFFEKQTEEKPISSFKNAVYEGGTIDKATCRASYAAQPNSQGVATTKADVTDKMTCGASTAAQPTFSHKETNLSTGSGGLRSLGD